MVRQDTNEITHEAIVQSIDKYSVTVLLSNNDGCSGCKAEKACGMSNIERKEIVINGTFNVLPGSMVIVKINQSAGYSALFFGYLLPLVIFLLCIVTLTYLSVDELIAGMTSLGTLIPYYLIIFLFRKSINRRFSFTLKT